MRRVVLHTRRRNVVAVTHVVETSREGRRMTKHAEHLPAIFLWALIAFGPSAVAAGAVPL